MNETINDALKLVLTAAIPVISGFLAGWFRRQAAKIRDERLRNLAEQVVADIEATATTYSDKRLTPSDKRSAAITDLTDAAKGISMEEAGRLVEWAVAKMNKDKPPK